MALSHVLQTLADLRLRREKLVLNLAELDRVIEFLVREYPADAGRPGVSESPSPVIDLAPRLKARFSDREWQRLRTASAAAAPIQSASSDPGAGSASAAAASDPAPAAPGEPLVVPPAPLAARPAARTALVQPASDDPAGSPRFGVGLVDAVKTAAAEARWNQIEMVGRVLQIRPGTKPNSAQTQIYLMLRERRLHKGDDLVIRNVVDGRIQNLDAAMPALLKCAASERSMPDDPE